MPPHSTVSEDYMHVTHTYSMCEHIYSVCTHILYVCAHIVYVCIHYVSTVHNINLYIACCYIVNGPILVLKLIISPL